MLSRKKGRKSHEFCVFFFPLKVRKVNLACANADTVAQLTPGWLNSAAKRFFKMNASTMIFFTTFIISGYVDSFYASITIFLPIGTKII